MPSSNPRRHGGRRNHEAARRRNDTRQGPALRAPGFTPEGIVAKGLDDHYKGGERQWVKVKRRNTIEVVAGAVIGSLTHPEAVVVGLPIDGVLRIVGRSTALRGLVSRSLGALLRPPVGPHPWPTTVSPGAVDRFNAGRIPLDLTLIEPIVVEVSADVARSGHTFRHSVRFLRARPELPLGIVASDGEERQNS